MSKSNLITLNISTSFETPTFWDIEGSLFRRASSEGPMDDAFPEYCDRSKLSDFMIKQIEVIRPGTYYGGNGVVKMNEAKMARFEANFDPKDRPPVITNHEIKAENDWGDVLDILTVAPTLDQPARTFALAAFKGDYVCERVNDGRWDRFSIGFFESIEGDEAWIYELSIVTKQAVPTARLSKETPMTEEEKKQQEERVAQSLFSKFASLFSPATNQPTTAPVPPATNTAEVAELQAKLAAAETAKTEAEALLSTQQAELKETREEAIKTELSAFVASGHSTPDLHEKELEFALTLSDEQRASFVALMGERSKVWTPGRLSKPTVDKVASATDEEDRAQLRAAAGIKEVKSDA